MSYKNVVEFSWDEVGFWDYLACVIWPIVVVIVLMQGLIDKIKYR